MSRCVVTKHGPRTRRPVTHAAAELHCISEALPPGDLATSLSGRREPRAGQHRAAQPHARRTPFAMGYAVCLSISRPRTSPTRRHGVTLSTQLALSTPHLTVSTRHSSATTKAITPCTLHRSPPVSRSRDHKALPHQPLGTGGCCGGASLPGPPGMPPDGLKSKGGTQPPVTCHLLTSLA